MVLHSVGSMVGTRCEKCSQVYMLRMVGGTFEEIFFPFDLNLLVRHFQISFKPKL